MKKLLVLLVCFGIMTGVASADVWTGMTEKYDFDLANKWAGDNGGTITPGTTWDPTWVSLHTTFAPTAYTYIDPSATWPPWQGGSYDLYVGDIYGYQADTMATPTRWAKGTWGYYPDYTIDTGFTSEQRAYSIAIDRESKSNAWSGHVFDTDNGGYVELQLAVEGGNAETKYGTSTGTGILASDNFWHRMVYVIDEDAAISIYQDGSLLLSVDATGTDDFYLQGSNMAIYGSTLQRVTSSIAFYDRALTAADVLELGGSHYSGIPEPATIGLLGLGILTLIRKRR